MPESIQVMKLLNFAVGMLCLWVLYRGILSCCAAYNHRRELVAAINATRTSWTDLKKELEKSTERIERARDCSSLPRWLADWSRTFAVNPSEVRECPEALLRLTIEQAAHKNDCYWAHLDDYIARQEKNWSDQLVWASLATQAGLLGTIVGIVEAFAKLGNGGDPVSTLGALSFCLHTTCAGLVTAIFLTWVLKFYLKPVLSECEAAAQAAVLDLSLRATSLRNLVDNRAAIATAHEHKHQAAPPSQPTSPHVNGSNGEFHNKRKASPCINEE